MALATTLFTAFTARLNAFRAGDFLAGDFLAGDFLAGDFLAGERFGGRFDCFVAGFLTTFLFFAAIPSSAGERSRLYLLIIKQKPELQRTNRADDLFVALLLVRCIER